MFPQVGRGSLKEVGVPVGGARQGQKQTNGVRASNLGVGLWGHGPSHQVGLINQVGVVKSGIGAPGLGIKIRKHGDQSVSKTSPHLIHYNSLRLFNGCWIRWCWL